MSEEREVYDAKSSIDPLFGKRLEKYRKDRQNGIVAATFLVMSGLILLGAMAACTYLISLAIAGG